MTLNLPTNDKRENRVEEVLFEIVSNSKFFFIEF
jgi:hypothetical protein